MTSQTYPMKNMSNVNNNEYVQQDDNPYLFDKDNNDDKDIQKDDDQDLFEENNNNNGLENCSCVSLKSRKKKRSTT